MKVCVFFLRSRVARRSAELSSMSWAPRRMDSITIPSQGRRTTKLPGCPWRESWYGWTSTRVKSGRRGRSSRLFEEPYGFARVRDAEAQERCVGARLSSRIAVVDVDSLIAEPSRDASELSRTTSSSHHLRHFGFLVI